MHDQLQADKRRSADDFSGASVPDERGFRLGRYELLGRIASGGMATVYRGRLHGEGGFAREFAIKVIHPHLADDGAFICRFLDEARIASRIDHPNVVSTVDIGNDRGYYFLVLGLIDGLTLRQIQRKRESLFSPGEAARIIADVARGLHATHTVADESGEALQVIHRDLSPHNIMLDGTGRTILIDLGLAQARDRLGHTQTGVLCGKLPYMSPEQSLLQPLDARSDVFSLGAVLFELATGETPFGDAHSPQTLDRLQRCDQRELLERMDEAGVPSWLSGIILVCLQPDPEKRFPSALELAKALESEIAQSGLVHPELRQQLSNCVRRSQSLSEPELPVLEALPPLIRAEQTADDTFGAFRPRWALRIGSIAAVVAGIGLFFGTGDHLRTLIGAEAQEQRSSQSGSLSADTLPAPSTERATKERPVVPERKMLSPEELHEDEKALDDEKAPPRRSKRRRNPKSARLRKNPYTD